MNNRYKAWSAALVLSIGWSAYQAFDTQTDNATPSIYVISSHSQSVQSNATDAPIKSDDSESNKLDISSVSLVKNLLYINHIKMNKDSKTQDSKQTVKRVVTPIRKMSLSMTTKVKEHMVAIINHKQYSVGDTLFKYYSIKSIKSGYAVLERYDKTLHVLRMK